MSGPVLNIKEITSPLTADAVEGLQAGDIVSLSGTVYTARDQAHKRFYRALEAGEALPVDLRGQTLFYAGPAPTPPGAVIGSLGPTTSARMDPFTPALLEYGLRAMIGKGNRSAAVREAITVTKSIYLTATGGAAAYLSHFITKASVVAYNDLGPEAVRRLELKGMPLVVGIDFRGRSALWPDCS